MRRSRSGRARNGRSSDTTKRGWCSRGARHFPGSGNGRSVHQFAGIREAELFVRPALLQDAIEVRLHDALVAIVESGEELDDRFARAIDEAARLAMRDRA